MSALTSPLFTNLAASVRLASAFLVSAALEQARSAPAPYWRSLYHWRSHLTTINFHSWASSQKGSPA